MSTPVPITVDDGRFRFSWDLARDRAELRTTAHETIWSGSLLPLFWLQEPGGAPRALSATITESTPAAEGCVVTLSLRVGELATGTLEIERLAHGLRFTKLQIGWQRAGVAIRALYFGASVLTPQERAGAPTLEQPFWPDWRAEGFCVASAKTNPMQSFFRSWDFGHASIPLGSFGPAMGTPYAAAFPRPHYAAALGGRHGWLCFGAGNIPDAALTLNVRARSGALEWLYREDLWGAPIGISRTWEHPLWLTWADTGWESYRRYFQLFPSAGPKAASHLKSFWGTWGDFRLGRYAVRPAVDRAIDVMEADLICIDDSWQASMGSDRVHPQKFATLADDLAYAQKRKLGVGVWLPMAWVADPAAEGLGPDDLLLSRDRVPVHSNWAIDPRESGKIYYCIDPSTTASQRFLKERTERVLKAYHPALLKIDFGYGLPGPDACAPRDPALRGERLAWTFARLISEAAHAIDPACTILYYSIHPLWAAVQDQCALDDLGDAGSHEASGHGQWSIWAALAAERGMPLLASSGYHWDADADNLLNSAVLGAPGANLPSESADGTPLPVISLARRRALFRWHRKNPLWTPLWLDSARGTLEEEPITRNWGRLETIAGRAELTALALREPSAAALADPHLARFAWSGRWIVLALGEASIFSADRIVVVSIQAGTLTLPRAQQPQGVEVVWADHAVPHADWSWQNGRLELRVSATLAAMPFLGLLVS